jgi:hypothetical protein
MVTDCRKLVLACTLFTASAFGADASFEPSGGMVPNAETAVDIAVAVFKPIYGADKIKSESPFQAEINGEVWHVYGSLPVGWKGGTAEAELSRKDGRILRVWHGK